MDRPHAIVIVGGGFGGLYAAQSLKRAPAQVTLIDRRNHHLFQPLLYQVASGELSPANVAAPLRSVLRRQKNTLVLMAEVKDFDVAGRRLILSDPQLAPISYDTLIVATGSQFNYFGNDRWAHRAPGLKSIEDAVDIRQRVLSAFERAELETDRQRQLAWMTFVVVGGGATGVEMAGALAEVSHHTLKHDFRNIHPDDARIILIEAEDHLLGQFPPDLERKAAKSLEQLGVTLRLSTKVTDIDEHGVTVDVGGHSEKISARVVLWTAGVKASPLGAALAAAAGAETDRSGRLKVEPDLTLPGHPEIFVIGDLAHYSHQNGKPLPGLAPVAMQQGRYVTQVIQNRLHGRAAPGPFRYWDRGTMATIGRAKAVAAIGRWHLSGVVAWMAWLLIHLMFIVQFQNRLLILMHWAYSYFTRGRAARLITLEHDAAGQGLATPAEDP